MGAKKTSPKTAEFIHLHTHTQYSLLDGLTKIPALIDKAKEQGSSALAITDHGTMSGAIEFYNEAASRGIKPIIGMEAYVAPRNLTDKDPSKDKNYYHIILLAQNLKGYQNLMRISSIANLKGFYYKPRIDHNLLEKYSEGLIVLSGCIGGEVGDALRQGQYDQAKSVASWYKKVFGDRYYLEVQDHGHAEHPHSWKEQIAVTDQTFKLAQELSVPVVLSCDSHYLNQTDQEAHEVLLCVQTGSFLTDTDRMTLKEFELHLTDPAEIYKRWGKSHPEIISNTVEVAKRCNLKLELGKILIPKYDLPQSENEATYLQKLVFKGLAWRYGGISESAAAKLSIADAKAILPKKIITRADYELGVISSMGFNSYFLIISDFVNWGKNQGIVFGPGRGSAAGSIISYSLKITELDPLAYDLLFERFLNPDRVSMPDIDIDIQDSRREEVINYCVNKYGQDRVANIVTFGRMAARNAVRDVARVLQVPYSDADRLAKMIPPPIQGRHTPLSKSLKEVTELKNEYKTNETAKRVFDLAVRLEGTIRSHGVHAAGVVIAPDDIVKFVPLELAQKGVVATQYPMGPIEELGLLKIDFLGLSNLTIIKNCLRIVKKVHNKDINIDTMPLDDKKTFELFQRGDTTGVFQLESSGMKRYLKELKPTVFEDIIAMVALYRPGPMQWIEDFVARKHGNRKIEYQHEAMEPALANTYGVIVYQEQVMQISKEMCGFSGGQADTLRKAIGKKKPEELAKLRTAFIEGAIKKVGASQQVMERFWSQLEAFAAYCFPKSHASCYAMIAYWTAYLKAHYPDAFMAALMTSDYDNIDRLAIEISECRHMAIRVLPPDVNESFVEFAVVPGKSSIRFGMSAIKNVGTGAVEEIIRAREADGPFKSLEDFLARVNLRLVNRKTLESLIKTGALDRFGDRGLLAENLDAIMAVASKLQKDHLSGQTGLFSNDSPSNQRLSLILKPTEDSPTPTQMLAWERELLGIYLSHHPLAQYEQYLAEHAKPISSLSHDLDSKTVKVGGTITENREIVTKNGQKMAFVKLTDTSGEIELIVFPKLFNEVSDLLIRDSVIMASGKVSAKDKNGVAASELKILANKISSISEKSLKTVKKISKTVKAVEPRLYLRLDSADDKQMLAELKNYVDANDGDTEVILVVGNNSNKQAIKLPSRVNPKKELIEGLESLIGKEKVKLS